MAKQANGVYWATYYNGATGYRIDANENACAYTATVSNTTITLHKLGKVIPAGTAVILVGDDNCITMSISNDDAENLVANDLQGVDVSTQTSSLGTGTFYVLGNKNSKFGFHEYTGNSMPARKAYLMLSVAAAHELNILFGDEATGINAVKGLSDDSGELYNLAGQRVNQSAKGIYIKNGRKVVIK